MRVMCINGAEDLLTEGDIYTVVEITKNGNFILDEVNVPDGFTSFSSARFIPVEGLDSDAIEELEDEFWEERRVSRRVSSRDL